MSTVPAKHNQPLHNFTLPFLKWGQRLQVNHQHRHRHRRRSPLSDSDLNNRRKPHRVRDNSSNTDEQNGDVLVSPDGSINNNNSGGKLIDVDVAAVATGDAKPWNLRPRRLVIDTVDCDTVAVVTCAKSGRLLRDENDEEQRKKMKMKRRLWISLSKEEIEEDIYAFTGSRPSRRPKKRSKIEQKQLDNVFPGLYLVGISADSYRV